ncbi:uncharacterized protein CcaverHIS019_0405480 [Cutaneotrichosporon cavernicola]|uniref:25S rRNA adenine-N(1) methyltransferase n=1 Tax=Cutaneotrichosporon cavernicola TaxID=279322 RepID=A0AA48QVV3_9TREE|nr:uncharacterized protein CcaverHIS019_0405480 [Cutaneotrichosporon cavernicola]BEI91728.1 hypothetical protein CcaverHIS019_0405480 [Cutaneotrichosporon cavernicola]
MGRTKRTRKAPLVPTEKKLSSASHKVTQSTISTFHTLLKRRKGIERQLKSSASSEQHQALEKELKNIDRQADEIGGLEAYQQASTLGQSSQRGGDSSHVLIKWLKGVRASTAWGVPLRLVLNFVPDPKERGRMLRLCRAHLLPQPSSMLFIVLPFPCVSNSRYTTAESFKQLVTALGFKLEREQWRPHGKVAYWLFRWCSTTDDVSQFKKKRILNDGPTRNNFTILVE